ncbi:MAG TPA: NAD-dependent epimerase/dehydratase family protein [Bacteroidota bacterium]|nr:NAD-dependent epimerase/dehydratase family protein [Bacteroidota bacterium]
MQTILGSGGAIGIPLARELKRYTDRIRLVSRNPKRVNDSDELFSLDLADFSRISEAVAGSDVVYVTVGFQYSLKVWRRTWPPFMKAVIDACKRQNAKLVFFDNVYVYAKSAIPHMTEDSPIQPPSKKGLVRQQLHEMIMSEAGNHSLKALIARSADFLGPDTNNSVIGETVAKNLIKGKKAQVFGDVNKIHTFTYTPDAAKAAALLGNTIDAYDQVWHVPTTKERLTMLHWIELFANELHREPRIRRIPKPLFYLLGVLLPLMREFPEMMYQNKIDYVFDSSKFEKRFGIVATPPAESVRVTVDYLRRTLQPRGT